MGRALMLVIAITVGMAIGPAGPASAAPPAVGPVVMRTIRVPGEPRAGAVSGGALWVLVDRSGERRLVEIGPAGRRTGRDILIATGVPPDFPFLVPSIPRPSLAVTPGAVWTVDPVARTLVRVSTADATVDHLPVPARYIAAGEAGLWVLPASSEPVVRADGLPGLVYPIARIDPEDGLVAETLSIGPGLESLGPVELGVTGSRLRFSFPSPQRFSRVLDLATGSLTVDSGFAWQLTTRGGTAAATRRGTCDVLVTPDAGAAQQVAMVAEAPCRRGGRGTGPRDVALGPGEAVWALYDRGHRPGLLVGRTIGSALPRVAFSVGNDPVDVVASGRIIWVLDRAGHSVTRMRLAPG